jgi:4-methylaminobutanoate oxidase (formaldehyde-forming)
MDGIPETFSFDELPVDFEHIEPQLEKAMRRVPVLADYGLQVTFNGPESFTPDDRYLLGEAPELRGLFVAAGFNSIGIQSAGGAGKVLADWIVKGHPPIDLWTSIFVLVPFPGTGVPARQDREGLGLRYAMNWPFRQPETAAGAPLGSARPGWPRGALFWRGGGLRAAKWFGKAGSAPRYEYSYGRPRTGSTIRPGAPGPRASASR